MKKLYLFAALATMLAACSENDLTAEKQVVQQNAEEGAVLFESYVNRPTTRSGQNGTITNGTDYYRHLKDVGFGVFGFYTDDNDYDGQTMPNFMYNEKIFFDTKTGSPTINKWIYEPLKYWPNEYGNSAIADDADKVSFFAYAPYVQVTPNTGKAEDQTYGITQLSRNSINGDPYVKYIASFDWTKNVDLLWGVCDDPSWAIVAGENQQINDGAKGLPWLNVQRPKEAATQSAATQRVKLNFKHALSQLNVVVDYDADIATHTGTANKLAATTRVYVRSVTFTGFSTKGTLNLNNTEPNTPLWMGYDGISDLDTGEETTIYDGRKDGKEGTSTASNEKNAFLNPALIQTTAWNSDNKGVQNVPQNLFYYPGAELVTADMLKGASATGTVTISDEACIAYGLSNSGAKAYSDAGAGVPDVLKTLGEAILNWPVMVIPNGDEVTVTIVYDVETVDNKLATTVSDNSTKGSSIENCITKTITFNSAKNAERNYMEAGKKYTIQLHLGLNSVKFDADVTAWDTKVVEGENWFPANTPTYQAPGVYDYTVAADADETGSFTINGFSPNEALTLETAATGSDVPTITPTITSGSTTVTETGSLVITKIEYSAPGENTTVLNKATSNFVKFKGVTSGKELTLNLVQLAAQPKVNNPSDDKSSTLVIEKNTTTGEFTLKDGASTSALNGAVWTGATRNVTIVSAYRNGYAMTELDEASSITGGTALQFCCDTDNSGKIILGTAAKVGEVFIFTIKAGDSGEVTITCKVAE